MTPYRPLEHISFSSPNEGARLIITGAVHGNEVCGARAIGRFVELIRSGAARIVRGTATFVPVCNPLAYELGERYVERNLNRWLVNFSDPQRYEDKIGNILLRLLESHDSLLDLHSSPRGQEPYIFVGPENREEHAFAASLGVRTLVNGWEDIYPDQGNEGVGTEQVMRAGGKIAALMECGGHDDPRSEEVAFTAIASALRHFGMLDDTAAVSIPTKEAQRLLTVTHVFRRSGKGGKMAKEWTDFSPAQRGELLATQANGEPVAAPYDGLVVLPMPNAKAGDEWLYFGRERKLSV